MKTVEENSTTVVPLPERPDHHELADSDLMTLELGKMNEVSAGQTYTEEPDHVGPERLKLKFM